MLYTFLKEAISSIFGVCWLHSGRCSSASWVIRGTHSIKDTPTTATGAVVHFHHSVLHDGGINNLVLRYADCGMVIAARWIAKLSTPFLLRPLCRFLDYKVKVRVTLERKGCFSFCLTVEEDKDQQVCAHTSII